MAQRGARIMSSKRVIAIDRLPERLAMASEHLGGCTAYRSNLLSPQGAISSDGTGLLAMPIC
jgi:threonine dehydrogenase-like Zn-dependent dehydrogenase